MKYFDQFESDDRDKFNKNSNRYQRINENSFSDGYHHENNQNSLMANYEDLKIEEELKRSEALSTPLSYILLLPSFFGLSGIHRLYMGKIGTGILYFLTLGLFGFGTLYDLFTIPKQIDDMKARARMMKLIKSQSRKNTSNSQYIKNDMDKIKDILSSSLESVSSVLKNKNSQNNNFYPDDDNLDRLVLNIAKKNGGVITIPEFTVQTNISIENAKKCLENMSVKGFIEMGVSKMGQIVYFVPDFLTEEKRKDLEID